MSVDDGVDVELWRGEPERVQALIGRRFARAEPRRRAGAYVRGCCTAGAFSHPPSRITGVDVHSGAVTYAVAPPRPDLGAAFAYSAESATVFF